MTPHCAHVLSRNLKHGLVRASYVDIVHAHVLFTTDKVFELLAREKFFRDLSARAILPSSSSLGLGLTTLEDGRTLASYNIQEGATLDLDLRGKDAAGCFGVGTLIRMADGRCS